MLTGRQILVVDDSRVMREEMRRRLCEAGAEVVEAGDPYEAVEQIRQHVPDAILLDIEMPRMSGLTFLQKLMRQHPMPVIVCSSAAVENPRLAFQALENGALEVLPKPSFNERTTDAWGQQLLDAVVRAIEQPSDRLRSIAGRTGLTRPSFPFEPPQIPKVEGVVSDRIIAVGASTGGTRALAEMLADVRADSPAIVIVQHMPRAFTGPFSEHLNRLCKVTVKEAQDGDMLLQGRVLIAPGGRQMEVRRSGLGFCVSVMEAEPVNRHCPSVDVLFDSVALCAGRRAVGVLLTGMGDDGARGLLRMREAGAHTIAQDEASCVVFGMPREAIKRGGACEVLPLNRVAVAINQLTDRKQKVLT
ncbi:chemotaxis response regulator protein-glutamate methylesterase [Nibricoccus sp. IMCC34717]|uniref:protein-glutamate methylesterase/protein-glutamine glutaminase n=1 Tax=Nibricoccus sp. IMCC34717 TaxID=3034021 RepID=UPI00384C94F2